MQAEGASKLRQQTRQCSRQMVPHQGVGLIAAAAAGELMQPADQAPSVASAGEPEGKLASADHAPYFVKQPVPWQLPQQAPSREASQCRPSTMPH